jgi:hypothetical protein
MNYSNQIIHLHTVNWHGSMFDIPGCSVSEKGPWSAGSFQTFVLKEGTTIICAGTVRIFGTMMAEIPFVGTKEGHRCAAVEDI